MSDSTPRATNAGRIVSLDVFRGVTIAAMILVNDPGGPSYAPLDHAAWNGWTHTDLIFPFFMFIAGASMALSFEKRGYHASSNSSRQKQIPRYARNDNSNEVRSRHKLAWHTLRRGPIIFIIGLWLNLFPYFFSASRYEDLRIPGVLQRIGFCYVFVGIIYLYTSQRARIGIIAAALLGYWAAMTLVPVPGVGAGDLSPNNNLAAYIDNAIFTTRHMWQHRPWDPEGLLSSVPAMCTMLLGTFVGRLFLTTESTEDTEGKRVKAVSRAVDDPTLRAKDTLRVGHPMSEASGEDQEQGRKQTQGPSANSRPEDDKIGLSGIKQSTWQYKVKQLLIWGVTAVVLGEVWGLWFPINKNLWTSSYVIFTAGYAMLALAAFYWIVDVRGWRKWATPFLVFGCNAMLAFTLSTWTTKCLLIFRVSTGRTSVSAWSWIIGHSWHPYFQDQRNSSLAFATSYVLVWMAVMWWFYRKKIFVKI